MTMDDPGTAPIRKKRNSSIRIAANCVRDGRAAGLVSAGHTGAGMVAAKMVIGTIEGVDRPALATILPNLKGHSLLLDVGHPSRGGLSLRGQRPRRLDDALLFRGRANALARYPAALSG